jgi:hypothetical protein
MSTVNLEKRITYCYSRVIIVLAKKFENIQWIVATEHRYVVMAFGSHRQVDRCILVDVRILS